MQHRWGLVPIAGLLSSALAAAEPVSLARTAAQPASSTSAAEGSARGKSASPTIDAAVEQMLARQQLPGAVLLLARHGQIVHQRAYGAYTLDTRLPIASASKWVSAAVLQRLVDRDRLDWNAPISRYVDDLPADKRDLSVRQLFSLTSGLPGGSFPDGLPCLGQPGLTLETCARAVFDLTLTGTPGTVFDYGGNAMQAAGWIAEQATGQSWEQLFRRELAEPLGWQRTDWGPLEGVAISNPRIGGGLWTTAGEYMQLLQFELGYGAHADQRLFDRDTVADARSLLSADTEVLYTPFAQAAGYGFGRWIDRADAAGHPLRLSSPGAFGATPWIDPRAGIAGMLLIHGGLSGYQRTALDVRALQDLVAVELADDTPTLPFADVGGVWWNPAESGAGWFLQQNAAGVLVLSWYTFDDDGVPLWLVATGGWVSPTHWQGSLFETRYRGSDALRAGIDPALIDSIEAGSITLRFDDARRARLDYQLGEVHRSLVIERFAF